MNNKLQNFQWRVLNMAYRALVSFSGIISMAMGEIREIDDEPIAKDLLRAGYIEELKEMDTKVAESSKETKNKRGVRKK